MPDNILITGAAGYLGHRVAKRLSGSRSVLGMDLNVPAETPCRMIKGDIRDPELVNILETEKITHVIHLASVLESTGDRELDYDIDVNGTRNVVDACLEAGVQHLTVTSSGAAYGYHADNPAWLDEDDVLRADRSFAYAWHKLLVEHYLADVRRSDPQLKQLILRPGTVLGAKTCNQITDLFEKKRVLAISGSDSPFVFLWDDDLAAIVEQGVLESRSGIFNLAGDGALTIREVATMLDKTLLTLPASLLRAALWIGNRLGLTRYQPAQVNFLRYRPALNNRRLKEDFGYQPQMDSRQTFAFFIRHARQRGQL
jgi:UDP-glucose 4-epimerase